MSIRTPHRPSEVRRRRRDATALEELEQALVRILGHETGAKRMLALGIDPRF